jgi:hypothetical protein
MSSTEERFKRSDGTWDPARVTAVHEPILRSFGQDVTKAADGSRVVYMTGGGFGSGKSTLLDNFAALVGFPPREDAPRCDPDAAKQLIPEMAELVSRGDRGAATKVHEESSHLAREGVARALSQGRSVVYDTSGDTSPVKLAEKVRDFRRRGATRVIAHYAFPGSIPEAWKRVQARQNHSQGIRRVLTRPQVEVNHREVSRCWQEAAAKGIFDDLALWSTAGPLGGAPTLIARVVDGHIRVLDQTAYDAFVRMGKP